MALVIRLGKDAFELYNDTPSMFSKKTWQRGDSYIFLPVLKLLCDKVEEEIGTPVPSYDQMPRIVKFIISEKNEKDTPERKAKIISSVEAVVKQLQKFVG